MKLYAQHGHGPGNKISRGLKDDVVKGVILSPRDERPGGMQNLISQLRNESDSADIFLDPQLYTTVLVGKPTARVGSLPDYSYFPGPRHRTDYENVRNIDNDIEECLKYQSNLPLTGWISPNILVGGGLDSIWGGIAKNFIRRSVEISNKFTEHPPVYPTFALSVTALSQKEEIESFLDEVSIWEDRPAGFYLLVACDTTESRPEVYNREVIGHWLYLTYGLACNDYEVIVGYSDYLSPFLWISGACAGATGWFENLKRFSLERFIPTTEGGRQPLPRYSSAPLLNRILIHELTGAEKLKISQMRSNTPYEDLFSSRRTPSREDEILQHWAAINSLNSIVDSTNVSQSVDKAITHISTAESVYSSVSAAGISFNAKSDDSHLVPLKEGLEYFRQLAEL